MRIVFSRSALARWCVLALSAVPCGDAAPGAYGVALDRCPYAVLGIRRDSTIAEIRAAYRVQAKATHPDKQQQGDSAQAEDRFLEVVAAFELLSDERERRVYDQTGHRNAQRDAQRETYERRERDAARAARRRRLHPTEQRAMARVMAVKSRQHLEDAALGASGLVDRHFILALYDEGQCEDFLTDSTVFPFPFADKLDEHGIWWEDVLQTAKARLSQSDGTPSRLARRFGLDGSSCPVVVFARNGSSLWEDFEVIRRPTRASFEAWVWERLSVDVLFVNDHHAPVRFYWIRGSETHDSFVLQPYQQETRGVYISHLFAARDERATGPLTRDSTLAWRHIDSDAHPVHFRVESKCVDWHGDCGEWGLRRGECRKNPIYMNKFCPVTCARETALLAASAATLAASAAEKAQRRAEEAAEQARRAAQHAARLRDDALAAEILAEATAIAHTKCDTRYPERLVRKFD